MVTALGAQVLLRQPDGTFYVVGVTGSLGGLTSIGIVRYDRNGKPDETFGPGGLRNAGVSTLGGTSAATDPNGDLYIALNEFSRGDLAVAKYDNRGNPVATFGTNGVWRPGCSNARGDNAIATGSDGSIYVAAGCQDAALFSQAVIWRLDARGVAVATFANGGSRTSAFGTNVDGTPLSGMIGALRVDAGGNVYLGGQATSGSCPVFTIVKMDSVGRNVGTFGVGGVFVIDTPNSMAERIAFDGHSRLYASGRALGTCPIAGQTVGTYIVVRAGA
jgi:hypothetical protein